MYDCKAPLSRFYYPDTRRIINAFIIIIIIILVPSSDQIRTETVPQSSDHYGTTKVAPPSDLTLPKCRLLYEVDYESMPSFPIFRCSL